MCVCMCIYNLYESIKVKPVYLLLEENKEKKEIKAHAIHRKYNTHRHTHTHAQSVGREKL